MGDATAIEWTDATWNPVRGCSKISPGCKHCYAATFAERWRGVPGHAYEQGFDLRLVHGLLDQPLRWQRPRRIFVNSMSDLHHEGVPTSFIDEVVARMLLSPRHTFQVLTKRADRMRAYYEDRAHYGRILDVVDRVRRERPGLAVPVGDPRRAWTRPWIHLGVSVEDRKFGVPRIDELRATPAAVRFLSIEPLLEDLGELDLRGIGWVIAGGESGPGARPCEIGWIRSIIRQARAAGVPCFVKQLGARPRLDGRAPGQARGTHVGETLVKIRHRKGADRSEWPRDLDVAEFPEVPPCA